MTMNNRFNTIANLISEAVIAEGRKMVKFNFTQVKYDRNNHTFFCVSCGAKLLRWGNVSCPKCGKTMWQSDDDMPVSATYFPDRGAVSIFTRTMHTYSKDGEVRVSFSKYHTRYTFGKKGQTYAFPATCLESGRKRRYLVNRGEGKKYKEAKVAPIRKLTMALEMPTDLNLALRALALPTPTQYRFGNATETIEDLAIVKERGMWTEWREIRHKVRFPQVEDCNDQVIALLLMKKFNLPNTKKMRKFLVKFPVLGIILWNLLMRKHGCQKIDSFWMMADCIRNRQDIVTIYDKLWVHYGEKFSPVWISSYLPHDESTYVKAILNDDHIFDDANTMLRMLAWRFDVDTENDKRIVKLFKNKTSIKAIHDGLGDIISYEEAEQKRIEAMSMEERAQELRESADPEINKALDVVLQHTLNKSTDETVIPDSGLSDIVEGIEFRAAHKVADLAEIANRLHNCVYNCYSTKAMYGVSQIVSMVDNDKIIGCIEVRGGKILQAYGPCNKVLTGNAKVAVEKWAASHELAFDSSYMESDNELVMAAKFMGVDVSEHTLCKVNSMLKESSYPFGDVRITDIFAN